MQEKLIYLTNNNQARNSGPINKGNMDTETSAPTKVFTRSDYMNSYAGDDWQKKQSDNHHKYYSQFVTPAIIELVLRKFPVEKLAEAYKIDEHLNNLGGNRPWDMLEFHTKYLVDKALLKEAKEGWSLSTNICILKAAAKLAIGIQPIN